MGSSARSDQRDRKSPRPARRCCRAQRPDERIFVISRPAFERAVGRLSGQGFRILVDLFASTPIRYRFAEMPYVFRQRLHGGSKLDSLVAWEYLMLLLDKRFGHLFRFASFPSQRSVFRASLSTSLHFIVRCRQQIFRLRKAVEQSRQ